MYCASYKYIHCSKEEFWKLLSGNSDQFSIYFHCLTHLKASVAFRLCVCPQYLQSGQTLCDPLDRSPLGSSVHGILQAGILQWVAMLSSRASSWPRDRTCVPCISCTAGRFFTHWATWELDFELTCLQLTSYFLWLLNELIFINHLVFGIK